MKRRAVKAARLNRHKKAPEAIISVKGTSRANIGVNTELTMINNTPPAAMANPLNLSQFIFHPK